MSKLAVFTVSDTTIYAVRSEEGTSEDPFAILAELEIEPCTTPQAAIVDVDQALVLHWNLGFRHRAIPEPQQVDLSPFVTQLGEINELIVIGEGYLSKLEGVSSACLLGSRVKVVSPTTKRLRLYLPSDNHGVAPVFANFCPEDRYFEIGPEILFTSNLDRNGAIVTTIAPILDFVNQQYSEPRNTSPDDPLAFLELPEPIVEALIKDDVYDLVRLGKLSDRICLTKYRFGRTMLRNMRRVLAEMTSQDS